ncbi:MAG: sulfatase-like hydrolase/transferase, partial [Candidatus Omnitrophica bacterium]|nr:sulfatase-like hydrolase/transferase [Candidatus Omnitrophota bacterium]
MNKKKLISISLFPVLICYGIFIFFIQTVDFFDKIKKSDYSSSNANVILIVIETLRADHLGVYGYSRNTSPFLDLFAQENVMFEYAFSTSSWTLPSVSSIFTSFYPSTIF